MATSTTKTTMSHEEIRRWVEEHGGSIPTELGAAIDGIASSGGTPLVVAENGRALEIGRAHV